MKIVIIGSTGIIGQAVVDALSGNHNIVKVGNRGGDLQVDISSTESIKNLYDTVGNFDAVVSAAGQAKFGALAELTDEDYSLGLNHKLMGQINLVRLGMGYINDSGSFTLTSGLLAREPMPGSAAISPVNAGLNGFTRAAALEMPRGIRINVVSPIWVKETMEKLGMDTAGGMSAEDTARAYVESVESSRNGEVLDVRGFA
jgi:NAD(P)-dependent dehydrogenase (short-subunit alcohol dehydrogenase family)